MKNIAIIPARSGSKGLKDKNIKLLNGKPLITYTIEAARKSGLFDVVMVSTDSEKYAEVAREWGADVPFLRSEELSSDSASSWDTVKDVLLKYEETGVRFDTVALLQPTSPLRTSTDIIKAYNEMEVKNANAIVAVSEVTHSPLWSNILPDNHSLKSFISEDIMRKPRQSLPVYYNINGALYIVKADYLINSNNIYKEKSFAIVMSKEHSIDIDDEIDFQVAQVMMSMNKKKEDC